MSIQSVTMSYKGIRYHLGHIMPVHADGKQQFIIIPNFDFRPPFMVLRLKHAHVRMYTQAQEYLSAGNKIYGVPIRKCEAIEPEYHIDAKTFEFVR